MNALDELFKDYLGLVQRMDSGPGYNLWATARAELLALREAHAWIAVSERLPEKRGTYLVACQDGFVQAAEYSPPDWWMDAEYKIYDITHWQPLPPPPQIVQDELRARLFSEETIRRAYDAIPDKPE